MSATLITKASVRPGMDREFTDWKARHDQVLGKVPGFVSSDMLAPPLPGGNEWTIVLNFRSKEEIVYWQNSSEHGVILANGRSLFEDGSFSESIHSEEEGTQPKGDVTEVIFSRVKPGEEDTYREWAARMQAAQARSPGYKGTYLQPPAEGEEFWTTIMRFDSAASLKRWMFSGERKAMLREAEDFIEREQLMQIATVFPGWVPIDPKTGKGPPSWKTSLLVLLGLFPIAMVRTKYFNPVMSYFGAEASLAFFIGTAVNVFAASYITMPYFVRWFRWWLFPGKDYTLTTSKGIAILFGIYAIEIIVLWNFLPR